jgi:hypothetical protein
LGANGFCSVSGELRPDLAAREMESAELVVGHRKCLCNQLGFMDGPG